MPNAGLPTGQTVIITSHKILINRAVSILGLEMSGTKRVNPDNLDEQEEKNNHRQLFNADCFKGLDHASVHGGERGMTDARYNLIRTFLSECNDPREMKRWKESSILKKPYRIKNKYILENDELFYQDNDGKSAFSRKKRKVARMGEVFDVIYAQHFGSSNHRSYSTVWNAIKEVWSNVTEQQCKTFQDYCQFCKMTEPKKKRHKGSNHPIRSRSFRDRYQMDLIDYNQQAVFDYPDEIECRRLFKYVLVLRDHFTRLVVLRPLQGKSAKIIAWELAAICNLIGFPLILQTDNGSEFTAEDVITELNIISPYAHAIHGRPRTPRDQGSVERANRMIKDQLTKAVAAMKTHGVKEANWVTALPKVMAGCNSGRMKGKNELSPYKVVFGMDYDNPIISVNAAKFIIGETLESRARRIGGSYQELMEYIEEEGYDEGALSLDHDDTLPDLSVHQLTLRSYNKEAKGLITKQQATFFSKQKPTEICEPVGEHLSKKGVVKCRSCCTLQ
jgi:hypothetical protein